MAISPAAGSNVVGHHLISEDKVMGADAEVGETRLRALMGTPPDPVGFGYADFDQRPDRVHFSVAANGVAQDEEVVTGTVRVITNAAPITELRGEPSRKSGEDPGIIEVAEATWFKGTNLLVQLGRLDQTRFPGNESCETKVSVGPLDGSLAMADDGMAKLDIQSDVPDLIPGTKVDLRIRTELLDEQGQRQRHETRWAGILNAVAPASGVIFEEAIEFALDP